MDFSSLGKNRTAVMGFAALWVFYFHIFPCVLKNTALSFIYPLEWFINRTGYCGVDIFLLLSGYGLYFSFKNKKRSFKDYYLRRFLRVYPAFFAVGTIAALFDGWGIKKYILNILFISQLTENIYSFLWFIPLILIFYIFAPFYWRIFEKSSRKGMVTFIFMSVPVLVFWALSAFIRTDLFAVITRIPIFILGFYFAYLSENRVKYSAGFLSAMVLSLALGCAYSAVLNLGIIRGFMPFTNSLVNVLIAPPLAVFISIFAEVFGNKLKLLLGFLNFYGTVSLEFYCVQEWIFEKIKATNLYLISSDRKLKFIFAAIVCFAVSTLAAYLLNKADSRISGGKI